MEFCSNVHEFDVNVHVYEGNFGDIMLGGDLHVFGNVSGNAQLLYSNVCNLDVEIQYMFLMVFQADRLLVVAFVILLLK